jgi:replicative DNA helicase
VLRQLITAGNEIVTSALQPEGREAREIVDGAERVVFEIAERGSRGKVGFQSVKSILPKVVEKIDEMYHSDGKLTGISSGFKLLDDMTSGLNAGDLIIIAGRPSMGKTTLAVNIAENAALGAGKSTAIFSMEMSSESLTLRMISSLGRINQGHLRSGRLSEDDWPRIDSAMTQLSAAQIYVDETPALTPTEVRARARRLKRERGLDLIVVDYLQLMQVAGTKENRATEISEISRSLKALAKELKIPVIAVSQLNRGVEQRENKKPVMSDLRESGAIEQDSDMILLIYREDYYDKNTTRKGIADINIAKQRNGPTGEIQLTFLGEYTKFENYAPESYGEGVFRG